MPRNEVVERMSREVKPVHAQAFFTVAPGFILYYLIFDYYDPLGYYEFVIRNENLFNKEIMKLSINMQSFLDNEKVIVNGVRVRPRVDMIDMGFRGSKHRPYITFLIRFSAPIRIGKNTYENKYEPEIAQYDYVAYWSFPPKSKILEVIVGENYDILHGNLLVLYGKKGVKTLGYEKIVFEIPKSYGSSE
ncbi:MAG: hypothetical protein DRO15_04240 [Thermoprotei archaeon]|nr:MAG: hypothetical protein DRO15_04240 [Thermoprotei archaeon]